MNYLKNVMVVSLLLTAHTIELFGAIGSRGVRGDTEVAVKSTTAPRSSVEAQRLIESRGTASQGQEQIGQKLVGQGQVGMQLAAFKVIVDKIFNYLKLPDNERTADRLEDAQKARKAFDLFLNNAFKGDEQRFAAISTDDGQRSQAVWDAMMTNMQLISNYLKIPANERTQDMLRQVKVARVAFDDYLNSEFNADEGLFNLYQ